MKKNNFLYFLIILILLVLFYSIYFNREGFYTSDNITNSVNTLNELLSGNLEQLKTTVNDLMNQKYKLSISEIINMLNSEYGENSKLNEPEYSTTNSYLKNEINNITIIQQNINNINNKIDKIFEGVRVEIVNIDTQENETYSLSEALNKLSLDIKKTSNSLSQIPS